MARGLLMQAGMRTVLAIGLLLAACGPAALNGELDVHDVAVAPDPRTPDATLPAQLARAGAPGSKRVEPSSVWSATSWVGGSGGGSGSVTGAGGGGAAGGMNLGGVGGGTPGTDLRIHEWRGHYTLPTPDDPHLTLCTGELLEWVLVVNEGSVDAAPHHLAVGLRARDGAVTWTQAPLTQPAVPGLKVAHTNADACMPIDTSALPPGDYTLELKVDSANEVAELNEANNATTGRVWFRRLR